MTSRPQQRIRCLATGVAGRDVLTDPDQQPLTDHLAN
jgi:hypothetical protein